MVRRQKEKDKRKRYWTYVEKDGGRDEIRDDLAETMRSHYDRLERIADDVERLGYKVAAEILRARCRRPQGPFRRSRRDIRDRAGRGGDRSARPRAPPALQGRSQHGHARRRLHRRRIRGAGEKLWLLKGEAKSNKVLGKATVTSARKVLNRDNGRCTPDSLLFVANRLLESNDADDNALGRGLRDEVGLKSLRADRIDHMLFTVSGNGPHASLKEDLEAAGTNRDHYVVNIHIEDHQDFIKAMYQRGGRPWRRLTNCTAFLTSATAGWHPWAPALSRRRVVADARGWRIAGECARPSARRSKPILPNTASRCFGRDGPSCSGGRVGSDEQGVRARRQRLRSLVRNGDPESPDRGFRRTIAAAAYHLAGFSAVAYSLFNEAAGDLNFTPGETAVMRLVLRDSWPCAASCAGG